MILLDTHAWLWWLSDEASLSPEARTAIEDAAGGGGVAVSTMSSWEVALLVARGRLGLSLPVGDWIEMCEALPALRFIPPSNRIMLDSVNLPGSFHSDPADRIIVATARSLGMRLVTRDTKIRNYPHVATVW